MPEVEETEVEDQAQEATETSDETTEPEQGGDSDEAWDPKRAMRKIQKLNREAASLREKASTAESNATEKSEKVTALEAANLRYEVALDLGLPKALAKRLTGDTLEEIQADAEELLALVTPSNKPVTQKPSVRLRGGGAPDEEPEETDVRKLGERMFAR